MQYNLQTQQNRKLSNYLIDCIGFWYSNLGVTCIWTCRQCWWPSGSSSNRISPLCFSCLTTTVFFLLLYIILTDTCELGKKKIFNYFLDLFAKEICGHTQNKISGRAMPSDLLTPFGKFTRVFCAIDFTIFNSSSPPLLAFYVLLFLITIHHGQVFYPVHSGNL